MKDKCGIYIHVPFCKGKCPYCAFYSLCSNDENLKQKYICKIIELVKYYSSKYNICADSLYIGGGTPSLLSTNELTQIINCAKENFKINNLAEITIEINPRDASNLNFDELNNNGVNRISIGMQSANQNELKILGRNHTNLDVENCVSSAKKAGINNISLDLILAIPGQTKQSLNNSINFCKKLDVAHISAYILTLEKNTYFYNNQDKFNFLNEDKQADLYTYAVNELEKIGFHQYEISSFAKPNFKSKHNLKYWNLNDYIGIGPSAHSFFNGKRFYYSNNLEEFLKAPTVIYEEKSNLNLKEEFAMLKLRLNEGLIFKAFEEKFKKPTPKGWIDNAKQLEKYALVKVDEKKIQLTTKGFLLSNTVISKIIF